MANDKQHSTTHDEPQHAQACLMTEKEAAATLRMSVAWVRKRRFQAQPPYSVRLGASVRYRKADIEAFVESLSAPTHNGIAQ